MFYYDREAVKAQTGEFPPDRSDVSTEEAMSVTSEAIEKVKEMILSGELRPGEKLPRENELAERLGVSRSSLREAVRALAALNVIETRQGDGTYVTSLTPDVLLDVIGFGIDLVEDPTLLDVFQVRRFLETAATAAAAISITDDELVSLRDCMARMDRAESVEELVRADEEFHHIVAGATRNSVLVALMDNLSSRLTRARLWRGVMERGALERTKQWHHAILEGLEARDPELATAADLMHLAEGESWLRRALGRSVDGEAPEGGES
jgi:GntR family transcriptional regulator, transcriptional repressor for pyruvate dehydrogenase complex